MESGLLSCLKPRLGTKIVTTTIKDNQLKGRSGYGNCLLGRLRTCETPGEHAAILHGGGGDKDDGWGCKRKKMMCHEPYEACRLSFTTVTARRKGQFLKRALSSRQSAFGRGK